MSSQPDFRQIFESVPGSYLVLDPDLKVVAASDSYLATAALERDAIIGRSVLDVIPRNHDDGIDAQPRNLRASLERVLATGKPHRMPVQKYHVAAKSTEGTPEEHYWKPVNTPVLVDGRVAWIIHSVEHATDFIRLEQLEGENEEASSRISSLHEADRAKDEFIAIISHELRTPMTSILGWTRMLSLGLLDDDTKLEALEALERSTLAQAKLIEDLLDESRIASGKLRLELRGLDLRTVVTSAASMARPSAEAKDVKITVECSGEPCEVYGDPARLQQAVGNLLGNAIKFTPEEGEVLVRLSMSGDDAILEVTDTGKGMAAELVPYVFERFRQGEGHSAERQSGLGLGLSITRHVIEMHGGTVSASSPGEGKGSSFMIRLPLHEPGEASPAIVGRDGKARVRGLPDLDGVRVLIVEDEVDNRKVLATALRQGGAEVQCAGSAAAAFAILDDWKATVIVCDVALPDRDGCAFLTELREREADAPTPALALTVLGRPGEQARITRAGFEVFRQKPIDPVDLAFEVERLARRRKAAD